jgi:hypothetical protein
MGDELQFAASGCGIQRRCAKNYSTASANGIGSSTGNMRGVENSERGARYPAVDELRRGEWRAAAYAGFARTRNPI